MCVVRQRACKAKRHKQFRLVFSLWLRASFGSFVGGPKKSSVRSAPRAKHAQLASLSPSLSLTCCVFPSHAPLSFWQLSVPGENLLCFRFNLFYCEMHFRLQLRLRLRLVSFFLRFFSALILLAPKNRSQNELIRKCRVDFRPERNENKFNLSVSYAFHDTDSVAVEARWGKGKERKFPGLRQLSLLLLLLLVLLQFSRVIIVAANATRNTIICHILTAGISVVTPSVSPCLATPLPLPFA